MLVSVISFGSLWRRKFNNQDEHGFANGVFYNTTGIRIAGVTRQRPRIVGHARFHELGGFDPHHPSRMVGRVFDCAEPCVWGGENKLLFQRLLRKAELPDRYLVVIGSEANGRLQIGGVDWRSPDTWIISFSEHGQKQEAMLLMSLGGWIITELGRFLLAQDPDRPWLARLLFTSL